MLSYRQNNSDIGIIDAYYRQNNNDVKVPIIVDSNGKIAHASHVDNLAQMYRYNSELNTSSQLFDLIGNGNHGIISNAVFGQDGLEFNGVNSLVEYNGIITPKYALGGTLAVEHFLSGTSYQPRFIDGTNNTYPGLYLRNTTNGAETDFAFALWAQGKDQALTNPRTSPPNGQLVHVIYMYDGTNFMLYVNGILRNTLPVTVQVASRLKNHIGGSLTTANRYLKGLVCSVLRFTRALTPQEVMHEFIIDKFEFNIP